MSKIFNRIINAKTLLVFISILIIASIKVCHDQLSSSINWRSDETFVIESGTSLGGILKQLTSNDVVMTSEEFLLAYALLTNFRGALKAGEYDLSKTKTVAELLALLRSGKVLERQITFIEGWTFEQWRDHLKTSPYINQELEKLKNSEVMIIVAGKPELSPEGLFFPDTYRFTRGDSDIQILKRAHIKMINVLEKEWGNRTIEGTLTNSYQALILASIIESETGLMGDRGKVSQVFVNRLRRNIRLQSDPTVIYGLGKTFDGNLTKKDLRKPTQFNTYTNQGLPPTPIGMPSLASLRAALHPEVGEYLYFVAKGDGTTHFSKTLAEHNLAVEKYQRSGRSNKYKSSPQKRLLNELENKKGNNDG